MRKCTLAAKQLRTKNEHFCKSKPRRFGMPLHSASHKTTELIMGAGHMRVLVLVWYDE